MYIRRKLCIFFCLNLIQFERDTKNAKEIRKHYSNELTRKLQKKNHITSCSKKKSLFIKTFATPNTTLCRYLRKIYQTLTKIQYNKKNVPFR